MALVVEDGSGKADAESYVSVAAADAYHSDHGNTGWTGADAAKEAALREATHYLEGRFRARWPGYRYTRDQSLAWPRGDAYDANGWQIDADSVPPELTWACAELALRALSAPLSPDLARGGDVRMKRSRVGPVETETEWAPGASTVTEYREVTLLLARLLGAPRALGSVVRA